MFFFFFCGLETLICGPNYSEVFYGLNVPKFTSRILKKKKGRPSSQIWQWGLEVMLLTMFTNTCTVAKCILNHGRLETMTNIVTWATNSFSFETKEFMLAIRSQLVHFEKTRPLNLFTFCEWNFISSHVSVTS